MAFDRVIHTANKLVRVKKRHQFMSFLRSDQLKPFHAKIFTFGVDALDPVKAFFGGRHHDTACNVHGDVLFRKLFNLFIKLDRVLLKLGDIWVTINGVHTACRVPC